MRLTVDTDAVRSLSTRFAAASTDIRDSLQRLQSSTAGLLSRNVIGSDAAVGDFSAAREAWLSGLVQLVSSLSCISSKLATTANYYDDSDAAAAPKR